MLFDPPPALKRRLRAPWALDDHAGALNRLTAIAAELDRTHPAAAASLREGIEETITLQRLRVTGSGTEGGKPAGGVSTDPDGSEAAPL